MSELNKVTELIEAQGTAWEEFKKTNDAIIKGKADGKAVADLEAKLNTISAELDKVAQLRADIDAVAKKANTPDFGTDKAAGQLVEETKGFNDCRKSFSQSYTGDIDGKTYAQYKSAYWNWVRKGNLNLLSPDEQKAMSAGDDSNGGYLLPFPTVGRISARIYELSPIRALASVQPISTFALEGVYDNDESSYGWVGETAARATTTTPTLGKYRIEAAEMYADPKASQQLLDDSAVDVESWLAMKVADKFARVEGAAFVNGTGVGQPRGFATYTTAATADATRTWGQIECVKTSANGDFNSTSPADVLFSLIQAFKSGYLNGASWVTTREVIAKIRKLKEATTNAYMWQPGLQAGTPDKLLGYNITLAQDVPALATGSVSLWLANWKEFYQVVDRMGVRTLRDPYTDKPYVHFYSTKRVGGAVLNFEAGKCVYFGS